MANHGDDVTMPARPGAQNAKTILGVVVGYSLDEARQHFLGRRFRLRNHARYPVPPSAIQRRNCAGQAMCESISDARPRQNSNAADLRRFSMAGGVAVSKPSPPSERGCGLSLQTLYFFLKNQGIIRHGKKRP